MPSLTLSPIAPDSADDLVTVTMGSSRDESIFPSEVGVMVPPLGDVRSRLTADVLRAVSPLPSVEGLLQDLMWAPVAPRSPDIADRQAPCSANQVPRWWLAREGPFLAEQSPDTIRSFCAGCAFRNTTYRASDYASPSGEFGLPMHHPRFLKLITVPQSASLLEMGPGRWLDTLSRDQAMVAAVQLQWDVCLMQTNLDVLDQYTFSLQGTASKLIERSLGPVTFRRRRWRRVPSALRSAALPFRWGCGGPRWILYGYIRMAGSELADLRCFGFLLASVVHGLPHCMGYYLLVLVRGCPIVTCFEHVRAGVMVHGG